MTSLQCLSANKMIFSSEGNIVKYKILCNLYEKLLIVGDFNIHVCCGCSALAKIFVNLMEACDFVQWVKEPTPVHGHIVDLVLSHGFHISDVQIGYQSFSDHRLVVFSFDLLSHITAPVRPVK